eukprot:12145876-Alexandrium_andersonii.AAC.1
MSVTAFVAATLPSTALRMQVHSWCARCARCRALWALSASGWKRLKAPEGAQQRPMAPSIT